MALSIGQRVETLIDNNRIEAGMVGMVTKFDRWVGEEYPYIVALPDGRTAAYARFELRPITEEGSNDG